MMFTKAMKSASEIPGDLQTKFLVVAKERTEFRAKVQILASILENFFNKVAEYNGNFKNDGFEGLLADSNTPARFGNWKFNPSVDGIDPDDTSNLEKCRDAVALLKEKVTNSFMNLNSALKSKNDCFERFSNFSREMIGTGFKEDY